MSAQSNQASYRGLILKAIGEPLVLESIPMPTADMGSVVVKIISALLDHTIPDIVAGRMPGMTLSLPMVPGARAVGRVSQVGPDATVLTEGQLVLLEPYIRGRDETEVTFLLGASESSAAGKNITNCWRNGTFAEYVKIPLENCYALNEDLLCGDPNSGGFGYSYAELLFMAPQAVAYGGLRRINLQAGETILITPATGVYTAAAIEVASAMGAKVIAASRNMSKLKTLAGKIPRVFPVQITGKIETDTAAILEFGKIDAYLDLSPPEAGDSTHIRSGLGALKMYGRACLMGLNMKDVPIIYLTVVLKSLAIYGQMMYERQDVRGLIKMVESGALKLGKAAGQDIVGDFSLAEWEAAFEAVKARPGAQKIVVFTL